MNSTPVDRDAPEFADLFTFAQFLEDDGRKEFTLAEAAAVARNEKRKNLQVISDLQALGFSFEIPTRHDVRGFSAWDNNRWAGNECAGGSGHQQITGWAGQEG